MVDKLDFKIVSRDQLGEIGLSSALNRIIAKINELVEEVNDIREIVGE